LAKVKLKTGDGGKTVDFETSVKVDGAEGQPKKVVDFSKAVPISLGDWLDLERKGCVIINAGERRVNIGEAQHALDFIAHFARKADPTVGPADILSLPITTVTRLAVYIQQATEDATDPN
jgi:hypothetical protein